MYKTIRVMLHPNNKQQTRLFQCAGVARWTYNWALSREQENYAQGGKFLSTFDLQKEFTTLKKLPEFSWLNDCSRAIAAAAIKDTVVAYQRFFEVRAQQPKHKSKFASKPSFYVEGRRLKVTSHRVRILKLHLSQKKGRTFNWVKLADKNRLPLDRPAYSARVTFDGLNWWLSAVYEFPDSQEVPTGEPLGIDVGIKNLAVCSDGTTFGNINHTQEVRRLEKKLRRLQRQLSRKYEMNKDGQKYIKTQNILKLGKQVLRIRRRLTNIRQNHRHQSSTAIVKKLNKCLSKAIQDQGFYEFLRQLEYKSQWHNIQFIKADRFFPSSQLCHQCGAKNPAVKNLRVREWTCPSCGTHHDRDLAAAINLRNYGLQLA